VGSEETFAVNGATNDNARHSAWHTYVERWIDFTFLEIYEANIFSSSPQPGKTPSRY